MTDRHDFEVEPINHNNNNKRRDTEKKAAASRVVGCAVLIVAGLLIIVLGVAGHLFPYFPTLDSSSGARNRI